jgi:hypothetical protein
MAKTPDSGKPDGEKSKPAPGPVVTMSSREARQDIPLWVSLLGALFGIGLLLSGIWVVFQREGLVIQSNLMLSLGLALIAIAFGTRAKVANQNYYMVGAGAIAVIFFGLLSYAQQQVSPPPKPRLPDIKGSISGKFPAGMKQVNIFANLNEGYGRWEDSSSFTFFIPEQDVEKLECLRITLSGNPPAADLPDEYPIDIDAAVIRNALKAQKLLKLHYRGNNIDTAFVVYPSQDPNASPIKNCPGMSSPEIEDVQRSGWIPSLLGAAWAGDRSAEELVKLLLSDDSIDRRSARDGLAELGVRAIEPMMRALDARPGVYRIEVGVVSAMQQMLTQKRADPAEARKLITDPQFSRFAGFVAHRDPTIRKLATPALIELNDARAIAAMIAILGRVSNDNGSFNAALVLRSLYERSNDTAVQGRIVAEIRDLKSELGEKTGDLLKEILVVASTDLTSSVNASGWVYSGAVADQPWKTDLFRYLDTSKEGKPKPGEELVALTEIYLRKDMIQFDEKLGWVNAEAVGVIPPEGVFRVEKAEAAKSGYLWLYGTRVK